jgi:spoIIIJ-associated protein
MDGTEKLKEFIQTVAQYMQTPCEVAVSRDAANQIHVAIQAPDQGRILIGKGGQNLRALEHIARMVLFRQNADQRSVSIDINDYRAERVRELGVLVQASATRVRQTGKSEALEPMTAYERRIVHTELASYSDLSSESVGQDPCRRVVIKPL